jgi:hypothetical protein
MVNVVTIPMGMLEGEATGVPTVGAARERTGNNPVLHTSTPTTNSRG